MLDEVMGGNPNMYPLMNADGMSDILSKNNIIRTRITPNEVNVEFYTKPTNEQFKAISQIIEGKKIIASMPLSPIGREFNTIQALRKWIDSFKF